MEPGETKSTRRLAMAAMLGGAALAMTLTEQAANAATVQSVDFRLTITPDFSGNFVLAIAGQNGSLVLAQAKTSEALQNAAAGFFKQPLSWAGAVCYGADPAMGVEKGDF